MSVSAFLQNMSCEINQEQRLNSKTVPISVNSPKSFNSNKTQLTEVNNILLIYTERDNIRRSVSVFGDRNCTFFRTESIIAVGKAKSTLCCHGRKVCSSNYEFLHKWTRVWINKIVYVQVHSREKLFWLTHVVSGGDLRTLRICVPRMLHAMLYLLPMSLYKWYWCELGYSMWT